MQLMTGYSILFRPVQIPSYLRTTEPGNNRYARQGSACDCETCDPSPLSSRPNTFPTGTELIHPRRQSGYDLFHQTTDSNDDANSSSVVSHLYTCVCTLNSQCSLKCSACQNNISELSLVAFGEVEKFQSYSSTTVDDPLTSIHARTWHVSLNAIVKEVIVFRTRKQDAGVTFINEKKN